MTRTRVLVLVLVPAVGGAAFVLARPSERARVLRACHTAVLKAPGATGGFFNEQVARPGPGRYVVTGLVGNPGAAAQWTCEVAAHDGKVTLERAELR